MTVETFAEYEKRKTERAAQVDTPGVKTIIDRTRLFNLQSLGHPLIVRVWGGPFYFTPPFETGLLPSVNLVFVQDKNGNTGSDEPWNMGGGETDFVIYEGLSRVHSDAILVGSKTAEGIVLSIWNPELVKYRTEVLGKRRHPINVVATERGELDIENELMFNQPALEVVILTGDAGKAKLEPKIGHRNWVHVECTGPKSNLRVGLERLKRNYGVAIVSVIGGRNVATELINSDLVHDLYLTRTPIVAVPEDPPTPFYLGDRERLEKALDLIIRKEGQEVEKGVMFEHYRIHPLH